MTKISEEIKKNLRSVGRIAGFHGLKGEIKIFPLMKNPPHFKTFTKLYMDEEETGEYTVFDIDSCRIHKTMVLVKFKGYDDRTAAEVLSGQVYVPADELEDLDEDEFYIADLIGLKVIDETSNLIGEVINFSEDGQQKIFIKVSPEHEAKRDLIVPFVDEFIEEIDMDASQIKVKSIEGLMELAK